MVAGYIGGSIMTAAITAFTGPIGFIGLIVPHALAHGGWRRTTGSWCHAPSWWRRPFLIVCDTVARIVLAPVEIPVGVITALLGGPFLPVAPGADSSGNRETTARAGITSASWH